MSPWNPRIIDTQEYWAAAQGLARRLDKGELVDQAYGTAQDSPKWAESAPVPEEMLDAVLAILVRRGELSNVDEYWAELKPSIARIEEWSKAVAASEDAHPVIPLMDTPTRTGNLAKHWRPWTSTR